MDALILRNIRCFRDSGPLRIAPLTVLVGENSTGKTTFLAAARLACTLADQSHNADFNEEPFVLGTFEQIASYRGRKVGRAEEFTLGFQFSINSHFKGKTIGSQRRLPEPSSQAEFTARFMNKASQPFLTDWRIVWGGYGLSLTADPDSTEFRVEFTTPRGRRQAHFQEPRLFEGLGSTSARSLLYLQSQFMPRTAIPPPGLSYGGLTLQGPKPTKQDISRFSLMLDTIREVIPEHLYASAPIRTRPQRTYEPLKDTPQPEGGHMPMILAKSYGSAKWKMMRDSLEGFGKASGLFKHIEIKRLGKQESSPFQVMVKIAGPPFNLVDVGYGVSQILPIIVDILRAEKNTLFLLQQPEVHLHPRAQAELASLLGALVKSEKKRFIVETHSDYLLDRVRMDIRDGKGITPKDVSILYFERTASGVEVHQLSLDERGNILDAPPGYRRFFLDEEYRLLGGATSV